MEIVGDWLIVVIGWASFAASRPGEKRIEYHEVLDSSTKSVIRFVMLCMGRLPLRVLHALGAVAGWLTYVASPTYARRLRGNLKVSGVCAGADCDALIRQNIVETGKGVLELAAFWFAPDASIQRWSHSDTWGAVERARQPGQGVIFLTPHLGGFEMAAQYCAQRTLLTVLYRPPKLRWLEPLMIEGRSRWGAKVAPANLRGVRLFYKALQRGEAVGLLPDQTPGVGEGVWADFFGRPAYTMTLVSRLQKATGALLVMAHAERLPRGVGYRFHFEVLPAEGFDEAALNRAVEAVVRRFPAQYLWAYNRYKVPAGASAPGVGG